jgi:hypothetical protein
MAFSAEEEEEEEAPAAAKPAISLFGIGTRKVRVHVVSRLFLRVR